MSNEIPHTAKAWREEIDHLFGINWDHFIEWLLIAWLSAWIWTAWIVSNAFIVPRSGPITWIADVIREFGGTPAAWLVAIPEWLTDPTRAALLPISVVASAAFATLSVRSYKLTGLRVLALAMAAIAVEIHGSVLPLLWIALIAAVPCVISVLASFIPQDDDDLRDEREWSFFYAKGSLQLYATRVLALYVMPIAAPIVLVFVLVFSYRIERQYQPSEALGKVAAREIAKQSRSDKTLAEADPLVISSALVAAVTSALPTTHSQRVAASFDDALRDHLEGPTGAVPIAGRLR